MAKSWWSQPLHEKYVPLTPKQAIVVVVALLFVDAMVFDLPFIDTRGWLGASGVDVEEFVTDIPSPKSDVDGAVPVYVRIYCYEGLSVNQPGLAGTDSDQIVRIYDADGNLLEQKTTSSGTATLTRLYESGSVIYLQARQADVASADPYVSPVVARTVYHSSSLDATDTVNVDPIYVRDVTGTAPTIKVWDSGGNATTDNTQNYFNTTDTIFTVQLSSIDSDTCYGPEDFVDWKTEYEYAGGVFFVWKGTASQPFTDYLYTWSDPTNVYYVWKVADVLIDDSAVSSDDIVSIQLATDGTNLNADGTVVLDINDIIQLRATGMSSADLIDGGGITPSAITTKVA